MEFYAGINKFFSETVFFFNLKPEFVCEVKLRRKFEFHFDYFLFDWKTLDCVNLI